MTWADAPQWVVAMTALLTALYSLRRGRVESSESLERRLREQREEAELERRRRRDAEADRDRHAADSVRLRAALDELEGTVPLALLAPRLLEPVESGTASVLDAARDHFAVTTPSGGGRFLWLSRRWEDLLGWPREELLRMTWQSLVHPDDLRATRRQEAAAWSVRGVEVVNRYRRRDGSYVMLRWRATEYLGGISFAVALVEDGEQEEDRR